MFAKPLVGALLACSLLLTLGQVIAQEYPSKPIRFIVPSSPATTNDGLTRVITAEMSKILGQPIFVENKSGANQIIGVEAIARAAPDGYTVGILGVDGVAFMPLVSSHLRFDPFKDIVPVATVAEVRYVLAGPSARPWKSFSELVAYARANPGKLNYGSSAPQLLYGMMLILRKMNLDIAYIPYSGGGPYLLALAAGTVDMGIAGDGSAASLGERVQVMAITGSTRSPKRPNVPTFDELGIANVYGPSFSLFVPAGTAKPIVDRLVNALERAVQRPEVKVALDKLAFEVTFEKGESAARTLNDRIKAYADFAKVSGLKPE
jgi:tripartite-type tricarboxylate transporter receptor subunit TctC